MKITQTVTEATDSREGEFVNIHYQTHNWSVGGGLRLSDHSDSPLKELDQLFVLGLLFCQRLLLLLLCCLVLPWPSSEG